MTAEVTVEAVEVTAEAVEVTAEAVEVTAGAVKAAMLMAQKAAEIFVGAAALGGPTFMSSEDVSRIANRTDEHYRQRALKL